MEPVKAEDLARAYLKALQAKDKAAILSFLAEGFVLEVPFDTSGANDLSGSWRGLEMTAAKYDDAFRNIEVIRYVDLEITPGQDPGVAFAEGRGVMRMANGRAYENRYVFRFDVEGGKIRRIREYRNPVTAAISFGRTLPTTEVS